MSAFTERDRVKNADRVDQWKTGTISLVSQIDANIGFLVAVKDQFVGDTDTLTVIDGYIAQAKSALQAVVDKY